MTKARRITTLASATLCLCLSCRSDKPAPGGEPSAIVSAPASASQSTVAEDETCPKGLAAVPVAEAKGDRTCRCLSDPKGLVWGSGVYTLASDVCTAALHAGALTPSGGKVTLRFSAGCSSYPGSTNNGVVTLQADASDRSFHFPSVSNGKCPAPLPSGPCPKTFKDLAGHDATSSLACVCDATLTSGAVFGSGVYAEDSSICRAAVHAGVIATAGGTVTLHGAAGCASYAAEKKHGVASEKRGAMASSFYFPAAGDGACPK